MPFPKTHNVSVPAVTYAWYLQTYVDFEYLHLVIFFVVFLQRISKFA
jgi:hypothetical protein